ncbi:MAG: serine hydrolase [Gammaproteobacteria bacterium]|nr:serine hydrolase [Gammaproteobacteria bacterium]
MKNVPRTLSWRTPGIVAAVARGDDVTTHAVGAANLEYGIRLHAQSCFHLCSLTKQFIGFTVALLVRQGALSLQHRIRMYLPEFPTMQGVGDRITVEHLLYHTSGVRDYVALFGLANRDEATLQTEGSVLDLIVRQQALNFDPGSQHLYSNSGYFLLGKIIERVTSSKLGQLLHREIFGPLRLRETMVRDDEGSIIPNRAWGHRVVRGKVRQHIGLCSAAGAHGVYSTIGDLVEWDRSLVRGYGGPASRDVLRDMERRGNVGGRPIDYAFGMYVTRHEGHRLHYLVGGGDGYRHAHFRFPEIAMSVIVLGNSTAVAAYRLAARITKTLLGETPIGRSEVRTRRLYDGPEVKALPRGEADLVTRRYDGTAFRSEELDMTYRVAAASGRLLLLKGTSVAHSLEVLGPDRFASRYLWLEGVRDVRERVSGFFLSNQYARRVAFERCM